MAAVGSASASDTPLVSGGILVPQPHATRGEPTVLSASPDGEYLIYGSGPNVIVRSVAVCEFHGLNLGYSPVIPCTPGVDLHWIPSTIYTIF